eukprot:scaffold25104_cov119-Isochrysis_galbana.AAC.4
MRARAPTSPAFRRHSVRAHTGPMASAGAQGKATQRQQSQSRQSSKHTRERETRVEQEQGWRGRE